MARIGLYCLDVIGKAMAGPGIRYWEFAKALSKNHEITLFIPNQVEIGHPHFRIVSHGYRPFLKDLQDQEILIVQSLSPLMALQTKHYGVRVIIDAYDPLALEFLELFKNLPMRKREIKNQRCLEEQCFSFSMADAMICASEKQKDLWLGSLMTLKKITSTAYDRDASLKKLIDVVPFGLPSEPPLKAGPGLREVFGLRKADKVILWGGGIWNWFDPLTLIKAIKLLSAHRTDIKLVFMGIKHPNEGVPEMEISNQAVSLARDLGLLDNQVFFNYGWLPYNERQNFLLDADIGASIHLDHLETRYSFRTRMLDYLWAGLPIIATEGDSFAELIRSYDLGIVVPYHSSENIANAIISLLDDPERIQRIKINLKKICIQFHWETVVQPIELMIDDLSSLSKQPIRCRDVMTIGKSLLKIMSCIQRERGFSGLLAAIRQKLFNKRNLS